MRAPCAPPAAQDAIWPTPATPFGPPPLGRSSLAPSYALEAVGQMPRGRPDAGHWARVYRQPAGGAGQCNPRNPSFSARPGLPLSGGVVRTAGRSAAYGSKGPECTAIRRRTATVTQGTRWCVWGQRWLAFGPLPGLGVSSVFRQLLMVAKAVSPWFHPKNEESPGSRWSPGATTFATFNNWTAACKWTAACNWTAACKWTPA